MKITALYAALLAVLFLVLTFRTLNYRRTQQVEIGDGGDRQLLRRVRCSRSTSPEWGGP